MTTIETNSFLMDAKDQANARLLSQLNGLTYRTLSTIYPQAEVESWPIQKLEAERFTAAGAEATAEMAPLIARVCYYHHGPSDEASTLIQVREKVAAVTINAAQFAEITAFVNGCRARRQEQIYAQETFDGLALVNSEILTEISNFRNAAGI